MKPQNPVSTLAVVQRVITLEPVDTLKPDPRNPRRHTPRQVSQIQRSIEQFGFNVPVLVDGEKKVIAGHGRLLAARKLGLDKVPVIALEHLTPAQAVAFSIADNRLTEVASWDEALLAQIFTELSAQDLDFSLEDTGFTIGEIDLKIEGFRTAEPEEIDQVLPLSDAPAVSRLGDMWELGPHRIRCDNALQRLSFDELMGSELASVIFVDPPYNVRIDGHAGGNGRIQHREFEMASGEMSSEQFTGFLTTAFTELAAYSQPGSLHFVCMDWRHLPETLAAGQKVYRELKNLCVWVKDKGGMGSLYRSQHELILVFKQGEVPHRNNVQLGRYGRYRTNVWNYPSASTLSRSSDGENLLALHPTVKPVALIADALMDCSAPGDIVLDTFLGSGSTLLAAERTRRVCRGMELDPLYVDTAIRRWQSYTGQPAVHAVTGQTFDETQRERQPMPIPRRRRVPFVEESAPERAR